MDEENNTACENREYIFQGEREFPEFDAMPLVWRKLSTEERKLVFGYIHDMKQRVVSNDRVWTRETLKYLVKYVPLKHMKNISISYTFYKENPYVIDNFCADTVVDGDDVSSGAEEDYKEAKDQD